MTANNRLEPDAYSAAQPERYVVDELDEQRSGSLWFCPFHVLWSQNVLQRSDIWKKGLWKSISEMNMNRHLYLFEVMFAVTCLALGSLWSCSTVTPLPILVPVTLDSGWNLYKNPKEGFAITLPPAWTQPEVGAQAGSPASNELNPEMARILEWRRRNEVGSGAVFSAIEWPPSFAFASVGITKNSLPIDMTLDEYSQVASLTYEKMKFIERPISYGKVVLGPGEAGLFQYRMTMVMPNGQPTTLALNQYVFIRGLSEVWQIVFVVAVGQAEKYASTFEKIIESFEFIG